uniref:C2H2-type domain-containing protein n=1 Tax=Leptobrachium leishanense TaxID=445787 RepID=A0A8C5PPF5_9ANUR
MVKVKDPLSRRVLDLTLEIIFLVTGEDHMVVKIPETVTDNSLFRLSEAYYRFPRFNTKPQPHSGIHKQNNEKILELSNKLIQLLTAEVPIRCEDSSVYLSKEEWEYVERHKDRYKNVMMEKHQPILILDKPVSGPSHTPVSLSDSGNKHITNSVDKSLKKSRKGRAESATSTEQESLLFDIYSVAEITEYPPIEISEELAACEEVNLTEIVLYKLPENTQKESTPVEDCLEGNSVPPEISHKTDYSGAEPCSLFFCEQTSIHELALRTQHDYTKKEPFSCTECGKDFTDLTALKNHQRIRRDKKLVNCPECQKCFTQESHLAAHSMIHTGEKPFTCLECGKCFTLASHLATHIMIHTGKKPISCLECGQCFTRASSLARHKMIHTGQKLFKCSDCGKNFSRAESLVSHQRLHTG